MSPYLGLMCEFLTKQIHKAAKKPRETAKVTAAIKPVSPQFMRTREYVNIINLLYL
jgi:hypothetical protein